MKSPCGMINKTNQQISRLTNKHTKKTLGIIGYPLEHSFSPRFFEEKIRKESIKDVEYLLFPLPSIEMFLQLLEDNPSLKGVNVTHPCKEEIINYLDEIDNVAAEIGAVNVVKIIENGSQKKRKGYNTDVIGFRSMVEKTVASPITHRTIMV